MRGRMRVEAMVKEEVVVVVGAKEEVRVGAKEEVVVVGGAKEEVRVGAKDEVRMGAKEEMEECIYIQLSR